MKELFGSLIGTLASLFAASCCIAPTLFLIFGISAGGLGSLSVLEPYRWYFLSVAYLAVGYSFYKLYIKKPAVECACQEPLWSRRVSKGVTWVSLILLIFATFYPYVLVKIYGD